MSLSSSKTEQKAIDRVDQLSLLFLIDWSTLQTCSSIRRFRRTLRHFSPAGGIPTPRGHPRPNLPASFPEGHVHARQPISDTLSFPFCHRVLRGGYCRKEAPEGGQEGLDKLLLLGYNADCVLDNALLGALLSGGAFSFLYRGCFNCPCGLLGDFNLHWGFLPAPS